MTPGIYSGSAPMYQSVITYSTVVCITVIDLPNNKTRAYYVSEEQYKKKNTICDQ